MKKTKLLIFSKAPILGTVKTRLQPVYSKEQSLNLHRYLVMDTLKKTAALKDCEVELHCTPDCEHVFFQACQTTFSVRLVLQQGAGLGERMAHAMAEALTDCDKVVIIGTDCPEMTAAYIEQAIRALDNADCVIGPAADGGYVLLAMRLLCKEVFFDIDWGSNRVLQQSRDKLAQYGYHHHELNTLHDIDRAADLIRYPALLEKLEERI